MKKKFLPRVIFLLGIGLSCSLASQEAALPQKMEDGSWKIENQITEITTADYCEFLNATAKIDPLAEPAQKIEDGRWEIGIGSICILCSGTFGNYSYSVIQGKEDLPMTGISCFDATQYCNWKSSISHLPFDSHGARHVSPFGLPDGSLPRSFSAAGVSICCVSSANDVDSQLRSNQQNFYFCSSEDGAAEKSARTGISGLFSRLVGIMALIGLVASEPSSEQGYEAIEELPITDHSITSAISEVTESKPPITVFNPFWRSPQDQLTAARCNPRSSLASASSSAASETSVLPEITHTANNIGEILLSWPPNAEIKYDSGCYYSDSIKIENRIQAARRLFSRKKPEQELHRNAIRQLLEEAKSSDQQAFYRLKNDFSSHLFWGQPITCSLLKQSWNTAQEIISTPDYNRYSYRPILDTDAAPIGSWWSVWSISGRSHQPQNFNEGDDEEKSDGGFSSYQNSTFIRNIPLQQQDFSKVTGGDSDSL